MNCVTINGVRSTLIKGLLIQTLPPISKPAIRTQVDEIDGRDGDIITRLGYSAYDKQFTIGLYGEFNIDQVVGFFDAAGTVIFSNEPDKYYRFQILDQINFDKLIRFRTATVKMHCQPFKYSAIEKAVTKNAGSVTLTNNGNTISRPTVTIYGSGGISLSVNDAEMFSIALGSEGHITIDAAEMEAYKDTINNLKNRLVTGSYDDFVLPVGKNTISTTGTVTKIIIDKYSRWI